MSNAPSAHPAAPKPKSSAGVGMMIGWILSAVILLAIVVVIALVYLLPASLGNPTLATTDLGKLDAMVFEPDISQLVEMPTGSGAEKTYDEAIQRVLSKGTRAGSSFREDTRGVAEPDKNPKYKDLLALLERAANQGFDGQYMVFPSAKMDPITEFEIEDALVGLGQMAAAAGSSQWADKKTAEGDRTMRAVLLMGYRLWKHGAYVAYKKAGLGVMGVALASYAEHYKDAGDQDKARLAADLDAKRLALAKKWTGKEIEVAPRLNPNKMIPADLANIADHDKDRAWRIEGVMWMGVAKWTAAGGSRRAAMQNWLEARRSSSDPLVAEAAKNAATFTRENVRDIPLF